MLFWGDDAVTRYTDFESFTSIKRLQETIRWIQSRFEEQEGIRWGVFLKDSDCLNRIVWI